MRYYFVLLLGIMFGLLACNDTELQETAMEPALWARPDKVENSLYSISRNGGIHYNSNYYLITRPKEERLPEHFTRNPSYVDAKDFEVLLDAPEYGRDAYYVYYRGRALEFADRETFRMLDKELSIARDHAQVIIGGTVVKFAHPDSFELIDVRQKYTPDDTAHATLPDPRLNCVSEINLLWKDRRFVYADVSHLSHIDAATFIEVPGLSALWKKKVYADKNGLYPFSPALTNPIPRYAPIRPVPDTKQWFIDAENKLIVAFPSNDPETVYYNLNDYAGGDLRPLDGGRYLVSGNTLLFRRLKILGMEMDKVEVLPLQCDLISEPDTIAENFIWDGRTIVLNGEKLLTFKEPMQLIWPEPGTGKTEIETSDFVLVKGQSQTLKLAWDGENKVLLQEKIKNPTALLENLNRADRTKIIENASETEKGENDV